MNPAEYDAWYDSARGHWIGETEQCLLLKLLALRPGERILDVGCGTGWFTRHMAARPGLDITGVDLDAAWLDFARKQDPASTYLQADALALPFADDAFDRVFSVTALCFVADWPRALGEIVRVARQRFVIGLLNRDSLLWAEKGKDGGTGAYRGARWHTRHEIRRALAPLPVRNVRLKSAVFLPSGTGIARLVERLLPGAFLHGGFVVAAGDKLPACRRRGCA